MENSNEEPEFIEVIENDRCPSCNDEKAIGPHTCPYAEQINGDTFSLCFCCDWCEGQCAKQV